MAKLVDKVILKLDMLVRLSTIGTLLKAVKTSRVPITQGRIYLIKRRLLR